MFVYSLVGIMLFVTFHDRKRFFDKISFEQWCLEGSCRYWEGSTGRPQIVHGQWSQWADARDSCMGGSCSACQIKNQISVRRVVRTCENPA